MTISLTPSPDGLQLVTPYDAAFVAALKAAVPYAGRRWQKPAWIVDPKYAHDVAVLIRDHFGKQVTIPHIAQSAGPITKAVRLDYLGTTKERDNSGERSAYGHCEGGWNLVFPEPVLRAWFSAGEPRPDERPTLYAMLGIPQDADEPTIKKAYRRLALQWHPDRCKEPDAKTQFQAINTAYGVLSDPQQRRKYHAGLAFEASLDPKRRRSRDYHLDGYRAPLRCGMLVVEGSSQLGRLTVAKIVMWEDVTDAHGRTLVVSWPAGADTWESRWV